MHWEIDYALLTYTQLKKSSYCLKKKDEIRIDSTLNLANYLVDWDKSKLPKQSAHWTGLTPDWNVSPRPTASPCMPV